MSGLRRLACAAWLLLGALACDRGIAPYDPDETPSTPDLTRIFPERAAQDAQPGGAPGPASPGTAPGSPMPPADQAVRGEIQILPALAGQIPAGALLFVIARTGEGGPPLAVKRIESPAFPLAFSLGPDDRMIAARPFAGPLTLSAWLDTDGNVMTRGAGDFEGSAGDAVEPGARGVTIVIDRAL